MSRGGKAGGVNNSYFNVKNVNTNALSGIRFDTVDWVKLNTESVYHIENAHDVIVAQKRELDNWKEHNVYEEVEDTGQDVITTRWVFTEKIQEGKSHVKARLVARGFEEDKSEIKTDAPTVRKENLRLVCCIAAMNEWKIHSVDVSSVFLQGWDIDRAVYILPPPEANTKCLWKLKTSVYGLCDAPRSWYNKVNSVFLQSGLKRSKYDHELFYLRSGNVLQGAIGCHVDDFLNTGTILFHENAGAEIREQFRLSAERESEFGFLGMQIEQGDSEIILHQDQYIDTLTPIKLLNYERNRPLTISEKRLLKSFVGQLQWVAKHSRPDVSFTACELSTKISSATVAEVKYANKKLKHLQSRTVRVVISNTGDIINSRLVVYSDASQFAIRWFPGRIYYFSAG